MEFTARQILLNAEFTPVSSPDEQTQSPSAQTESDSGASPAGLTPFAVTPAAPQDHTTPHLPSSERESLADVTMQTTNEGMLEPEKPKKKRGRPKGWRKVSNLEKSVIPASTDVVTDDAATATETETREASDRVEKSKKPRKQVASSSKEEDQWSVRIRSSIEKELQESIAKGNPRLQFSVPGIDF